MNDYKILISQFDKLATKEELTLIVNNTETINQSFLAFDSNDDNKKSEFVTKVLSLEKDGYEVITFDEVCTRADLIVV